MLLKVKDLSTEPEIPLLFKKTVLSSNTVLTKSRPPSSTVLITSDKKKIPTNIKAFFLKCTILMVAHPLQICLANLIT